MPDIRLRAGPRDPPHAAAEIQFRPFCLEQLGLPRARQDEDLDDGAKGYRISAAARQSAATSSSARTRSRAFRIWRFHSRHRGGLKNPTRHCPFKEGLQPRAAPKAANSRALTIVVIAARIAPRASVRSQSQQVQSLQRYPEGRSGVISMAPNYLASLSCSNGQTPSGPYPAFLPERSSFRSGSCKSSREADRDELYPHCRNR